MAFITSDVAWHVVVLLSARFTAPTCVTDISLAVAWLDRSIYIHWSITGVTCRPGGSRRYTVCSVSSSILINKSITNPATLFHVGVCGGWGVGAVVHCYPFEVYIMR